MGVEEAWLHLLAVSCDWLEGQMGGAEEGQRLMKEGGLGASTPHKFQL